MATLLSSPRSLQEGAKYLGKQETTGANRGPIIDSWCRFLSVPVGVSWCAVYVGATLCHAYKLPDKASLRKALGFSSPFFVDSADAWYQQSKALKVTTRCPSSGDLGVVLTAAGVAEHIFFVASDPVELTGNLFQVHTLEGNTNAGGSRNGDGVYRRMRPVSASTAFFKLPAALKV